MIRNKFLKSKIFTFCLYILLSNFVIVFASQESINGLFEKKYLAWKEWKKKNRYSSCDIGCKEFYELTKLGIVAVPFFIQTMAKNPSDVALEIALLRITKKDFKNSEWPAGKLVDSIFARRLWLAWWPTFRESTKLEFDQCLAEITTAQREGNKEKESLLLKQIKDLGVPALPHLVEKISSGCVAFIPIVSYLTNGEIGPTASVSSCETWWKANKEKWLIPLQTH